MFGTHKRPPMFIFGIPGITGHELWEDQHGSRTGFGQIWSDFGGHVTENMTFFGQKPLFPKVIGNGQGMVWACFGTPNRCCGVHLIVPGSRIAWKTMDARDQEHAETGSKMTLFKSDWGVSGVSVEAFWDSRSVLRRGLQPIKLQNGMKRYHIPCMARVFKGKK
jgi:hypothetical protein